MTQLGLTKSRETDLDELSDAVRIFGFSGRTFVVGLFCAPAWYLLIALGPFVWLVHGIGRGPVYELLALFITVRWLVAVVAPFTTALALPIALYFIVRHGVFRRRPRLTGGELGFIIVECLVAISGAVLGLAWLGMWM